MPELRKVLAAFEVRRPDLPPLVVLVCFAGLRPSEAVRLDWVEVGDDYIRLPGKKSKTGYSRQIPIQDNLRLWLARWRQSTGPVCASISLEHINQAVRRFAGIRLSHDAMRHGYVTHRQKVLKNVGAVAEEMGHTVQICRRHYLNAFCTEPEAVEWFNVRPETPTNVTGISNTTAWRWRRNGWLTTVNIAGRPYLTDKALTDFMRRAEGGEFAKDPKVPNRRAAV